MADRTQAEILEPARLRGRVRIVTAPERLARPLGTQDINEEKTVTVETTTVDKRRVELLSDLRVLLNWLEANPDVPLPRHGVEISVHVGHDNDEDGIRLVHEAAKSAGVEVVRSAGGAHHHANKQFGLASYQAIYIERGHMADFDRRQQIARDLAGAEQS